MAFFEITGKDSASIIADNIVKERKALKADWDLNGINTVFEAYNTLQIWHNFQELEPWIPKFRLEKAQRKRKSAKTWSEIQKAEEELGKIPTFQLPLPLLPKNPIFECSYNFGKEPFNQRIFAIDGGDQIALEFADGSNEGVGLVKYAWVAMQNGNPLDALSERREPQFVPADIADLYKFSLFNFNKTPNINPDNLPVRRYAAIRRGQLEFLVLNELIDYAEPGEIILLDGFLKAMFSPPIEFLHKIGKKAARKGVIILGIAKESSIARIMWLHFKEYWASGQTQSGWMRPPAVVTDRAYPSKGDDTNQYLYLGHLGREGRGIGFPIAATFSPVSKAFYAVDFNVYDFEAAQPYVNTSGMPEVQAKHFPLTTQDKNFITRVLAQVAYYADQITCLGYPFPTAKAHNLARINRLEVNAARSLLMPPFLSNGTPIKDLISYFDYPHKMLEHF